MAMKDQNDFDKQKPQVDAADVDLVRDLRRKLAAAEAGKAAAEAEIRAKDAEIAARDDQVADLAAAAGPMPLPEHEQPVFEIAGPGSFFSNDCVLYPPGSIIRDIYGDLPLNTEMIPCNEPAKLRLDEYLSTLPGEGQVSTELILESAFELRPKEGEDPIALAAFQAKALELALIKKFKAEGRIPPGPGERVRPDRPQPVRYSADIPIMTNTRIRSLQNPGDLWGAASRVDPGRLPEHQARTQRVR